MDVCVVKGGGLVASTRACPWCDKVEDGLRDIELRVVTFHGAYLMKLMNGV